VPYNVLVGAAPEPFVRAVLHPSDFTEGSEAAFVHALAIAVHNRARLTLLHAEREGHEDWAQFPGVRETLSRWRLLPVGSSRDDVFDKLALDVAKVQSTGKKPFKAIADYAAEHDVDLIVLTTEGRMGLRRLLQPSLAEGVARRTGAMALVVPRTVKGFVSPDDGRVSLRRLLVPVDVRPDGRVAVDAAARAARSMSKGSVEIYLLHVGENIPPLDVPTIPGCSWRRMATKGDVVSTISEMAQAHEADLIVMATEGHRDLGDALHGSVTERVLRQALCPVLAVPALTA
jgi:nucleotide-binding universal stress UspA family protein